MNGDARPLSFVVADIKQNRSLRGLTVNTAYVVIDPNRFDNFLVQGQIPRLPVPESCREPHQRMRIRRWFAMRNRMQQDGGPEKQPDCDPEAEISWHSPGEEKAYGCEIGT